MEKVEFKNAMTNDILKYYMSYGYDVKINIFKTESDESHPEGIAIRIEIQFDDYSDFNIFYLLEDNIWMINATYIMKYPMTSNKFKEFENEFNNSDTIFDDLLPFGEDLVRNIAMIKFYDDSDFNIDLLKEFIDYFESDNRFLQKMYRISEKND